MALKGLIEKSVRLHLNHVIWVNIEKTIGIVFQIRQTNLGDKRHTRKHTPLKFQHHMFGFLEVGLDVPKYKSDKNAPPLGNGGASCSALVKPQAPAVTLYSSHPAYLISDLLT